MAENERKPAIRFNGFTEAWEQRKLSELVDYTSSNLTASDAKSKGKYDLFDANRLIGYTDSFGMQSDYISVIKDGAGVGRTRILPAKTAFIGTMGAMTSKNSNLCFINEMLINSGLGQSFSGSTIPHIYFKDYGEEKHYVPKVEEQNEIATFLEGINNLITLHQRELEKLQNIKKACLEKMFV